MSFSLRRLVTLLPALVGLLVWGGSVLLAAPALHAQSFEGLGTLGGTYSFAFGVSADGSVVVGHAERGDHYEAFRWTTPEGMVGLGTLGGTVSAASDVSADDSVVVGYISSSDGPQAFRWTTLGGMVSLPGTPAYSYAEGISADGSVIVGHRIVYNGDLDYYQAFRWTASGGMMGLGSLNGLQSFAYDVSADGSVVVGYTNTSEGLRAFRWTASGGMVNLGTLGGDSGAYGVSADGSVVVGSSNGQIFRWTAEDGMVVLGPGPGFVDVSADGSVVVGETVNAVGDKEAFLWTEEDGMRSLPDILVNDYGLDLTGWTLSTATAISADGAVIVGHGTNPQGQTEAWRAVLVPVEENIVVNDTGDETDLDGSACDVDENEPGNQCTLRAALETANDRAGRDSISVNIEGTGVHQITLGSPLPALTEPLVLDATTQPGYAGTPLVALTGGGTDGFVLDVGQTTLRGLAVGGYAGAGIRITGPGGNVVEACHLGTNAAGMAAVPNGVGVLVEDSPGNTIGGETPEQRNVISGNTGAGVLIVGEGATGNVVAGNYVGTDATGAAALGNGAEGARIEDAPGNTIGGSVEGARNVIAASTGPGVLIVGETASGNVVAGNHIGTDAAGAAALGNAAEGIRVEGAPGTQIGGASVPERNVIAASGTHGVYVRGPGADGTLVQGDYIGVSADGSAALGNGTSDDDDFGHRGVFVEFASGVVIGGPTAAPGQPPGNVISASAAQGVRVSGNLSGEDAGPSDDLQILGNLIGLDAAGEAVLPNGAVNVELRGAVREAQIGQAGGGNVIASEDGEAGVFLVDLGEANGAPDGAHIAANALGLTAAGDAALGAMGLGIALATLGDETRGVEGVQIGGGPGEGNRISAAIGVLLEGERNAGTVVAGNTVGLLADGTLARTELDAYGIVTILADSVQVTGNTVGGQVFGVVLASDANEVTGNFLGTDPGGSSARPNTIGLFIPGELVGGASVGDANLIGDSGAGNVISGNTNIGLLIGGHFELLPGARVGERRLRGAVLLPRGLSAGRGMAGLRRTASGARPDAEALLEGRGGNGAPDSNFVAFNYIGTNAAGTQELGNGRADTAEEAFPGVAVLDGKQNVFLGNVISGNGGGINISVSAADFEGRPEGTVLAANLIGASANPESPIPNQYGGVFITQSNGNVVAALPLEEGGEPVGNIIVGNGGPGVHITNLDGFGHSNEVRQSSFLQNNGPSITFLNGDDPDATPPGVPEPPRMLSAATFEAQARLRVSPRATGPLDVFLSEGCNGGNAEGTYLLSVDATAGVAASVLLGYDVLGTSDADEAVGLYLGVTSTTTGETAATSAFSGCLRIAAGDATAEAFVPDGFTGDVGGLENIGLGVEVTDNPGGGLLRSTRSGSAPSVRHGGDGGTLYAARHDLRPDHSLFEGSATSDDGTTVTPNAVASARYWTLTQDGLDGIAYTACLDLTGIAAIEVPGQLLVVQRENLGQPWTPHASTLDPEPGRLCAAGLTAFGDLGIGADSTVNPVPNEPGPGEAPVPGEAVPAAFALSAAYPNPSRGRATLAVAVPEAQPVAVAVYDLLGRRVAVLLDGPMEAGRHPLTFDGSALPAGLYLVRAATEAGVVTRRLTLVR